MPVEKGKVLAKLQERYKGTSATKTYLEGRAAKWAERIDSDEDIDAFIDDRDDDIKDAISEADRRVSEAVKKPKPEPTPTPTPEPAPYEGTSEFEKLMLKKFGELEGKLSGFEQQRQQQTIAERFLKDERVKGIPQFFANKFIPASEEEYERTVTKLAEDYTAFAKENNLSNFGQDAPPAGQGKGRAGKKEASKEEIDAVMSKIR